ncbi:MAG: hypothetical protein FWC40_06975 [Proteobacteria bacterium]|nr:hypothetical protein [Pseudomonadota bacterium]
MTQQTYPTRMGRLFFVLWPFTFVAKLAGLQNLIHAWACTQWRHREN